MALALDTKLQEWRSRVQASTANAYFRWWLGELRGLMPESWKQRLQHALRRVTVELKGDRLVLGIEENRQVRELGDFSMDEDPRFQKQQIHNLLIEEESLEVLRALLLDSSLVLIKEVRMPQAAESNLRQVLTFEMDRQTPFKADDVYFDWLVKGHDKESAQVILDLVVAPRGLVDRSCEALDARGLGAASVDVVLDGVSMGLNLLPPERRTRVRNQRARLNRALALAAVLLLAVVMVLSLSLRAHQVDELQQAISEVREEALSVQRIRDQISDTTESAGFLAARRNSMPVAVDVLVDVTSTLPDDTHLDRLVVGRESVQMQGKSQNAQRLIEQVNASPMMAAAAFRGSTRLDARTGLEIFEINAEIEAPEGD